MPRPLLLALVVALAASCGGAREAPALPEALVVVDTDLPVPLVAARLRVDLFTEEGRWFDASDFGRPDPRDWPASFSVYSDEQSRERHVWARLRAYPEGAVDTYGGEARLVKDGIDVTPATEPSPLLTVDRLVLVALVPGARSRVQVVLHGACVGTAAQLAGASDSESCSDTARTREVVTVAPADADLTTPTTNLVDTWLTRACPARAPGDERACVPGGATILGSRENSDYLAGTPLAYDSAPPHVFGLSPFLVDRDELTVAALRRLVASGYPGPLPISYEGTLGQPTTAAHNLACTWSLTAPGRDAYPVTCVSLRAARAICQFQGGDLLTEAQWEHVATIAGHPQKVRFPWGQDEPTCDRAIWGRVPLATKTAECSGGDGPRLPSEASGDVSPLGIRGLFGGVCEWVLDGPAAFDGEAWAAVPIIDPHVEGDGARGLFRGNSWMSDAQRPIYRLSPNETEGIAPVGVRCAYPATP